MNLALRQRLLIVVLGAQIITVLALVLTMGRISSGAEADHTERLLSANAAESAEAIRAHLAPAESVVNLTTSLLEAEDVDVSSLEAVFREALDNASQISGVFLGSPDGDFTFVSRAEEDYRHKVTTVDGDDRTTVITVYREDRSVVESFEDPLDTYDPTTRPWFGRAVELSGDTAWTEPYVFFTSQQLGITVARAIERDGEVIGVIGADIELGELSDFLALLEVAEGGGTILVDRSGTVLAHPDAELLRAEDGDGYRTVSILEFEDSYAQSATAVLLQGEEALISGVQGFYDPGVGPSRVSFELVEFGDVEWILGVYAPEDAIIEELVAARQRERVLAIIVGALTVIGAALALWPITRRIDTLAERASIDELTGLANRRIIMAEAIELAGDNDDRALAMLDIDHFKSINDNYGHQVGDQVLKTIALRLRDALPDGADIGRIGGEEFLLLLPDSREGSAHTTADRIRATVRNEPIRTTAGNIDVSVSIGVAATSQPTSREELLELADSALRQAKVGGRNAVVLKRLEDEPSLN